MNTLKLLVVALAVILFGSPLHATKRIYSAKLSVNNELHQVVDSTARGAAMLGTNINGSGYIFQVVVRNLSGQPTGVHLHAPATESENAPIIITLCGNPGPAAITVCPDLDADGVFAIQGTLTPGLAAQWGLSGGTFQDWLEGGLAYVNVHTALNPAGEARGQLNRM